MKNSFLILSLLVCFLHNVYGAFPNVYGEVEQEIIVGDPGEPLLLTPYIEQNLIEEAQAAAEVNSSIFLGVKSYAGYFTVNETYNSNLFFWFFPSQTDYENDPVLLWLQGGPGAASLYGLFQEHGPFSVDNDDELKLREYTWAKSHSIVYIDNPVGAGYSFSDGGYAQNETKVAQDLYNALIQFFTMFPDLQEKDFYLTGESYAGKYIPAVGYKIHKENPQADLKINLKGLAIGNGLTDPEHQLNYGDYLFQLGLVDSNIKEALKENEKQVVDLIQKGEFKEANDIQDMKQNKSIISTATGYSNVYNYLYPKNPIHSKHMNHFLQLADIRSAIHVGGTTLNDALVYENLKGDILQSVTPWVSELLSNYRVMFYNGQVDIIVAYPLTVNFLQHLDFDAADEYKTAKRHIWYVDDEIAGYVKEAGNLTEVLIREAGHMAPADQPKWAVDMIYRFTRNQPLYDEDN